MNEQKPELIYLASAYTKVPDHELMAHLHRLAYLSCRLIVDGKHVFSPVTHCHPIFIAGQSDGILPDYNYWKGYNHRMIELCDALYIHDIPSSWLSDGVYGETMFAAKLEKPIFKVRMTDDLKELVIEPFK